LRAFNVVSLLGIVSFSSFHVARANDRAKAFQHHSARKAPGRTPTPIAIEPAGEDRGVNHLIT
jgi:hypothetical protein